MKVLIVQSENESIQTLSDIFQKRADDVFTSQNIGDAIPILQQEEPNLVILDLHLPMDALSELLRGLRERYPNVDVIISNRYPDLGREIKVKELGGYVFWRSPFSKTGVEQALNNLEQNNNADLQASRSIQSELPDIRMPVRFKIILPYLLLALLLAMGAGYVISRVALDTVEERFINNLIEIGHLASAWMVDEESNRLETLRLLTYTDGLAEAIRDQDTETLRDLALGLAINYQEESIEILDAQGLALISVRHTPGGDREAYDYSKGDTLFASLEFVQQVINQQSDSLGDKFAGLVEAPWGNYFYIAGPILNDDDQLIGAVLIGRSIPTIVLETREKLLGAENRLAHISLYSVSGQVLGTTLIEHDSPGLSNESVSEILVRQEQDSLMRPLNVAGINYREILSPWDVRGGEDLGLVGVSLAETFLVRPSRQTQAQIFILAILGLILIIVVGVMLARRITQPLKKVVAAASQVSQGKWNISVEPQGSDELAVLAHTFNYMVSHLKEGEIYRDLLGRTITPQVRDQLRSGLASGNLRLEGQNSVATVMITDIRGFTVIAENEPPTTILSWLNQYYGELVPIINTYNGVTNEFIGDSLMAFFGVLPATLDPSESAFQACQASVEILQIVKAMNRQRWKRGHPPMVTGIGVNTGEVAAGGMGTADRLHYSIIGDTVNVTQRLESLTREIGETSAIISQDTYEALGDHRENFNFVPMGSHLFKGKSEPILVYRLLSSSIEISDPSLFDINTALKKDWIKIIGISSKKSQNILKYREVFGDFSTIEEIRNIPGIGPKTLYQIKEFIKNQAQTERNL